VNSTYDTLAEDVLKVTYQGENFQKVFDQFRDFIQKKEEKEKIGTNHKGQQYIEPSHPLNRCSGSSRCKELIRLQLHFRLSS